MKRKWLKYIAVIFLNVPTITYTAVGSLSFELLSFQILLGISFGYMGYLHSYWAFGIPLGGLYWLFKLRQKSKKAKEIEIASEQNISEINANKNDTNTNITFDDDGLHEFQQVNFGGVTTDRKTWRMLFKDNGDIFDNNTVHLSYPSIFVRKYESGGGTITFNNGKYVWIHQND